MDHRDYMLENDEEREREKTEKRKVIIRTDKMTTTYRVFLSFCLRAQQLYRIKRLHPPAHSMTAAVLRVSVNRHCVVENLGVNLSR
jgi:hypothetical protein